MPKVHLTHGLQCDFFSGSIFICFCFTTFLWYFCFVFRWILEVFILLAIEVEIGAISFIYFNK